MSSKKWLKYFSLIIIAIGLLPYTFAYFFLKSNYENNSYLEIVERQVQNNSIFGTALNQNTFSYKMELIKEKKPKIVILGSSRVMQIRQEHFKVPIVNAGGAMNHLNEGYVFLKQMYSLHKPEFVILGIDFWWFNESYSQPESFPYHSNGGTALSINKIFKPMLWLSSGKLKLDTLNNVLDNSLLKNNYNNYDSLGFSAISTSDGFRVDGSYLHSKTIFGIVPSNDEKFKDTFSRIESGNRRFQYAEQFSQRRFEILEKIIELINTNESKLVLLVPPVANSVYKKMHDYPYGFVSRLREVISVLDESYDYHEASVLVKDDCEFIDGFHGGDVVAGRMLKDLYDNNSTISQYIDMGSIQNYIINYKGKALTVMKGDSFVLNEVDFLKLKCNKKD